MDVPSPASARVGAGKARLPQGAIQRLRDGYYDSTSHARSLVLEIPISLLKEGKVHRSVQKLD